MVQQDRRRPRSARTRIQPQSSAVGERIGSRRSCGAGGNYGWDLIPGRGSARRGTAEKKTRKKALSGTEDTALPHRRPNHQRQTNKGRQATTGAGHHPSVAIRVRAGAGGDCRWKRGGGGGLEKGQVLSISPQN